MGGAERAQRRRRQQAAQAAGSVSSARAATGGDRGRLVVVGVVVVLLAAAVIGGILLQRARSAPPEQAQPRTIAAEYPVRLDGAVVVAGQDSAKLTVDVYEDFLCPACGLFEKRDAGKIEHAIVDGSIKVRYHMVNLLDEQSNPPGYSLAAASAALCAAEAGQFPSFHATLFADQPREGGHGYTDDQLVQLGRDLGITASTFESCVRGGTHDAAVKAQLDAALADSTLRRTRGGGQYFSTPTILINDKIIDHSEEGWLDNAVRAAAG